jgi:5-methylcytosine-specific restriction endonuclease McrA
LARRTLTGDEMTSLELAIAAAIARDSLPERECRKCGELKGPGAFARAARARDGLYTWCKACAAAHSARYHAERKNDPEYREKQRERAARYHAERKNDPEYREKQRERVARYARENPDRYRAYRRKRRALKRRVYRAPYTEADILAGNGGLCRYCDAAPATALDHFIPISWGGDDAPWNLVGACKPCNSSKLDRDPYEWMASRGIDLDAWERRHIAGWFDLPAKLWKIAKVYRPPA